MHDANIVITYTFVVRIRPYKIVCISLYSSEITSTLQYILLLTLTHFLSCGAIMTLWSRYRMTSIGCQLENYVSTYERVGFDSKIQLLGRR